MKFPLYEVSKAVKFIETGSRRVQRLGKGTHCKLFNGKTVSVLQDGKLLESCCTIMYI